MTGLGFALLLLAALCADSLPNEAILPVAGVLVALALVIAAAGYKKRPPRYSQYRSGQADHKVNQQYTPSIQG